MNILRICIKKFCEYGPRAPRFKTNNFVKILNTKHKFNGNFVLFHLLENTLPLLAILMLLKHSRELKIGPIRKIAEGPYLS
jgi:hypothetical protein